MSPNDNMALNVAEYGPQPEKSLDSFHSSDSVRDMNDTRLRPRDRAKSNLVLRIPSSTDSTDNADELQGVDRALYETVDGPSSPAAPASPALAHGDQVLTPAPCDSDFSCSPLAQKNFTRCDSLGPVVPDVPSEPRKRKAACSDSEVETSRLRLEVADDAHCAAFSVRNLEEDGEIKVTDDFACYLDNFDQDCSSDYPPDVVLKKLNDDTNSPWVTDPTTNCRHYHTVS